MGNLGGLSVMLALVLSSPTAYAENRIPVVDETLLSEQWALAQGSKATVLEYPAEFADHREEVCLAVGYLINPDGHTSEFALLKSWSSREPKRDKARYWGAFARVASAEVSQWRFVPKAAGGAERAAYTVATFVFPSPTTLESSKRCAIPNLTERILELKQDTRASRLMKSNSVFYRLDLDPTMNIRYQQQRFRLQNEEMRRYQFEQSQPPPPPPPPEPPPPPPNPPSGG